jgi:hypothetical protein
MCIGFMFASFAPAHLASGCLRQATQPAPAGMCSCMADSNASLPIRIPARFQDLARLMLGMSQPTLNNEKNNYYLPECFLHRIEQLLFC